MHSVRAIQNAAKSIGLFSRYSSTDTIGFIGLGAMGSNMVSNLTSQGRSVIAYDVNKQAVQNIASKEVVIAESVASVVQKSSIIITMLPNDKIVTDVSNTILESASSRKIIHISCSTISPVTSRLLKDAYSLRGSTFIAAPVFARPDGIAKRQATWMIAGEDAGRHEASVLLGTMGKVVDYGPDVGAANVAKLCGNFLIASSIEAIAESMALAEKHGVDRTAVMQLLSSTIFDCLIYKGYGDRVSNRDHRPGGFSLELGLKDVTLVSQAAREADVPMPFLSALLDRFTSAKARGRAKFDWSAIGLSVAEDAGIDVSKDVERNRRDVEDGNKY